MDQRAGKVMATSDTPAWSGCRIHLFEEEFKEVSSDHPDYEPLCLRKLLFNGHVDADKEYRRDLLKFLRVVEHQSF